MTHNGSPIQIQMAHSCPEHHTCNDGIKRVVSGARLRGFASSLQVQGLFTHVAEEKHPAMAFFKVQTGRPPIGP